MNNGNDFYMAIAGNLRVERKRLGMSQARLAERADLSIDTVKAIEYGRRTMSLDTYMRIVKALGATPLTLMHQMYDETHLDRFRYMTGERSREEVEFILHMVEQLLSGHDCYLNG